MGGHFKGSAAKPQTIERRAYHKAYYREVVVPKVALFGQPKQSCPTCAGKMFASRERCSRCEERFHRWDKCACGREKIKRSVRCHVCAGRKSAEHRVRVAEVRANNPHCPNKFEGAGWCETLKPHAHCACGWPTAPDVLACHICIAEQSRIEFKVWPKESAA